MLAQPLQTLRNAAVLVTVVLLLVVCWAAGRLLLLDTPDAVLPAESSLLVPALQAPVADAELPPDLVERPLFWEGRDKYVPSVEEEVVESVPEVFSGGDLGGIELVGVIGADANTTILLRAGPDSMRLRLNDTVSGWEFVELTGEGAVLVADGRSHLLALEHAAPKGAAKRADRQGSGRKAANANKVERANNRRNKNKAEKNKDDKKSAEKVAEKAAKKAEQEPRPSVWQRAPKNR